jgi:hypothetical protein
MQEPKLPDNQDQDTQDSQEKGSWKDKFKTGFAKAFGRDHPEADSPPASATTTDAADDNNWKNKLKQTFSFGQPEATSGTTSAPTQSTPPTTVKSSVMVSPKALAEPTPVPVAQTDNGNNTAGKGNWKNGYVQDCRKHAPNLALASRYCSVAAQSTKTCTKNSKQCC